MLPSVEPVFAPASFLRPRARFLSQGPIQEVMLQDQLVTANPFWLCPTRVLDDAERGEESGCVLCEIALDWDQSHVCISIYLTRRESKGERALSILQTSTTASANGTGSSACSCLGDSDPQLDLSPGGSDSATWPIITSWQPGLAFIGS